MVVISRDHWAPVCYRNTWPSLILDVPVREVLGEVTMNGD